MNTLEKVAIAIWEARQEAHGRWPDDGPLSAQPEEVRDWVMAEARGAIEAMLEPGLAEHLEYEAFCDEPAAKDFRAMIDAILDGK